MHNVAHHRQEKTSEAQLSTVRCMRGLADTMFRLDVIGYCDSEVLSIESLAPVGARSCNETPGEKVGVNYFAALDH